MSPLVETATPGVKVGAMAPLIVSTSVALPLGPAEA